MATTDYHGWPLPDGTDLPIVHIDMQALGDAIDKELPIVVETFAAMQALPPILNLKAMVKNLNYRLFAHNGTKWIAVNGGTRHVFKDNSVQYGNGSGIKAKVESGEVQLLHQGGTDVATTDASGYLSMNFQEPFVAWFHAVVSNGDSAQGRSDIYSVAGSPFTHTASTIFISVMQANGTPRSNATVRFNFDVWGWS